jgi:hypothetical protein
LIFGSVSAQLQVTDVTCAFAEALPKVKNPRGSALHLFCQCSWKMVGAIGQKKKKKPIPKIQG